MSLPRYWTYSYLTMEQWLIEFVGEDTGEDALSKLGLFVGSDTTTCNRLNGLLYNQDVPDMIDAGHDDSLFERTETINIELFKFIPIKFFFASTSEDKYSVYFKDNIYSIDKSILDTYLTGKTISPIEPTEIPYDTIPDDRVDIPYFVTVISMYELYNMPIDSIVRPTGDDFIYSIIDRETYGHIDMEVPYMLIDGIKESFINVTAVENVDPVFKPWLSYDLLREILDTDIQTISEPLVRRFVWDIQRTFPDILGPDYDNKYYRSTDYLKTLVNRIWDEHNYNMLLSHFPELAYLREDTYPAFYRIKILVDDNTALNPVPVLSDHIVDINIIINDISSSLGIT